MWLKRGFVSFLESLCGVIDHLPGGGYIRGNGWWWKWRCAQMGCGYLHLSQLSADLDDKWGTGYWSLVVFNDKEDS